MTVLATFFFVVFPPLLTSESKKGSVKGKQTLSVEKGLKEIYANASPPQHFACIWCLFSGKLFKLWDQIEKEKIIKRKYAARLS